MGLEDDGNPEVMFMAVSSRVKPLPVGGGQATLSVLSLAATAFNTLVFSILTYYTPQVRYDQAWPVVLEGW